MALEVRWEILQSRDLMWPMLQISNDVMPIKRIYSEVQSAVGSRANRFCTVRGRLRLQNERVYVAFCT